MEKVTYFGDTLHGIVSSVWYVYGISFVWLSVSALWFGGKFLFDSE